MCKMNLVLTALGLSVLAAVPDVNSLDLRYVDASIDPCDDFYEFACGNFGKYHQRPPDQDALDPYSITEDELIRIGNEILSQPKHRNDPVALKKAKSAYAACVHIEETSAFVYYQNPELSFVEEFGGMPLLDEDDDVEKISFTQIAEISARNGLQQFFQSSVRYFSPQEYILLIMPDSMSEPQMIRPEVSKTYDQTLDDSFRNMAKRRLASREVTREPLDILLEQIVEHLCKSVACKFSHDRPALEKQLEDIKQFMTLLFSGGIVDEDYKTLGEASTLRQLQNWTRYQFDDDLDVNWVDYFNTYFQAAGFNVTEDFLVMIYQPKTLYGVLNLIRKTDPRIVKNVVLLRSFVYLAPDSDGPMRTAFQEYYNAIGSKYYERWEYCARKILDVVDTTSLSFAVAHDFVKYHFNNNKIPKVVELLNSLRTAFKSAVNNTDWVDPASRELIFQKIDNAVVSLGYPDFVDRKTALDAFYENVRICEWDNYGNAQRIRAFKQAYAFSEFVNHDVWNKSPFNVNAYATPALNRITVPIAMLHDNFYTSHDAILDYGRLGTVLAHEAVHHFDSGGLRYDQNGEQETWVSSDVMDAFSNKSKCLVEQYGGYYVPELGRNLDGDQCLTENVADNGGARHAFQAFERVLETVSIPDHDGYTARQLFFIAYATGWCTQESDAYLRKLVESDPHAPARYRVQGVVSNMREFAEAFQCPVGSRMNPERKCVVW